MVPLLFIDRKWEQSKDKEIEKKVQKLKKKKKERWNTTDITNPRSDTLFHTVVDLCKNWISKPFCSFLIAVVISSMWSC